MTTPAPLELNTPAPNADVTPAIAPVVALPEVPGADGTAPLTINPPEAKASDEVAFEYTPTGDPGLDLALDFVGKLGYGPQHEAIIAAQKGDFAKLDAALKAQGDKAKGHERFVALAKQSFERGAERGKTAEADTRKVVHEAAGGEKQWADIQAWAAANADPAEKEQINTMLKAGGLQARLAVQGLAQLFHAQVKTAPPASALKPGAAPAQGTSGALNTREYGREVMALRASLGAAFESSPEYAALQGRYRASR